MIQYRTFTLRDPAYAQELELRDDVLRRPLHRSIQQDDLSIDAYCIHLGAFSDVELVGVVQLYPIIGQSGVFKMRQFAVKPTFQGQQIGKSLLQFAEQTAQAQQGFEITLHARKVAVGFYLKQGYHLCGNEFTEVGIPHFEMKKNISSRA